jgi:apolipoprotein N-acyltransferase
MSLALTVKRSLLAALTGGLLVLSFPWPDLGWLVFAALAPLLYVAYEVKPRAAFGYGWFAGAVFFGGVCYWVGIYGWLPWLIMAIAIGSFFGLAAAAISWLAHRLPWGARLVAIPSLWAGLEILRSETGAYSYPYGVLGYSQHAWTPALGLLSLIGVYGLSWLIAFANTAIIEAWRARGQRAVVVAAITVAAIGLSLGAGAWASAAPRETDPRINVAIIQANIPQDQKWLSSQQDTIMAKYESLIRRAARGRPDLIVLPEAALPAYVSTTDPLYARLAGWARQAQTPILAGVPQLSGEQAYNSAVLFDAAGRRRASYAKMIPVLFGEQIPWRPVSEKLFPTFQTMGDISVGKTQTVFTLPVKGKKVPFGVLICSESMYENLARGLADQGVSAVFVLTNDAWFYSSSETALHAGMTAARAAETGRPIGQAANTGISLFVQPSGGVSAALAVNRAGVLTGVIGPQERPTVYTRGGWVFPYFWLTLSALLAGRFIIGERLHKDTKGRYN